MKTKLALALMVVAILWLGFDNWRQSRRIGSLEDDIQRLDLDRLEYAVTQSDLEKQDVEIEGIVSDLNTVNEGQYAAIRLLESGQKKLNSEVKTMGYEMGLLKQAGEMKHAESGIRSARLGSSSLAEERERLEQEMRFDAIEGQLLEIEADKRDAERQESFRRLRGK
jgi:hypothetical protein